MVWHAPKKKSGLCSSYVVLKRGGKKIFTTHCVRAGLTPETNTGEAKSSTVTLVAEKQGNSVFKNIPHLFGIKLGYLFMKNHQLLNSAVKKAVASLCVDVVRERESSFNNNNGRRECTTAASKTRARVSHFPTCNVQEQEDFEKTAFWRSHGTQHFKKLSLKMHFFFYSQTMSGKGGMQACAAGARYATFFFGHPSFSLLIGFYELRPSNGGSQHAAKFAAMQTAPTFTLHFSFKVKY